MSAAGLFDRDGHLNELALFRLVDGELAGEALAAAETHHRACALCQGHLAGLRAELAQPLPPLRLEVEAAPEAEILPFRRRLAGAAPAMATLLSLAAILLVFLRPEQGPDTVRLRGAGIHLEVYRQGAAGAERLRSGDPVQQGDKLAFRVNAPEGGHVLVFGLDASGMSYPIWPPDPALRSAPLQPSAGPVDLKVGLELDGTPGAERLIATRCPGAFSAATLYPSLMAEDPLPELEPGCAAAEVTLPRRAGAP